MTKILDKISFENIQTLDKDFTKHFHDTYTLGITYHGIFKSYSLNKDFYFYEKSVRVNNPGDIHGGNSKSWSHANFYPTIELLSSIYEDIYGEKKTPYFLDHIIEDKILYKKLHNFFLSYFTNSDKLDIETTLLEALSYLIINYTSYNKKTDSIFGDKKIVSSTYELIKDSLDTSFSLDELASNSNLSKYHFLRLFKKEFGLTPHNFIINQRINKAYELIKNGKKISEASIEVGFNDQSHFTRNFKKLYGYTPSYLIKNSNIVL